MKKESKQFIAGAVCPECGEEDSLVLFSESKNIACVSCDFEQSSQQRDSTVEDKQLENKTDSAIKITLIE